VRYDNRHLAQKRSARFATGHSRVPHRLILESRSSDAVSVIPPRWISHPNAVTTMTWLEIMEGTSNKANQAQCKLRLNQFEILYPTFSDEQWAMQQLEQFQFSHHIGKEDCLIASAAFRLQLPLYT
jgi:predicted nucleic acid-binding protein